jgi:hypothetical protein
MAKQITTHINSPTVVRGRRIACLGKRPLIVVRPVRFVPRRAVVGVIGFVLRKSNLGFVYHARRLATSSQKTHFDGFRYSSGSRWRMMIAYARVSTTEPKVDLLHDDLKPAFDALVDPKSRSDRSAQVCREQNSRPR